MEKLEAEMDDPVEPPPRRPVKHAHVLPRFYLDLFAQRISDDPSSSRLMQLDQKDGSEKPARCISVSNAAVRGSYYASSDVRDYEDFEKYLSATEDLTVSAVRKLAADPSEVDAMQWRQLALFFACQHMRSPFVRWSLGNMRRNLPEMSAADLTTFREEFSSLAESLVPDDRDTQARVFDSFLAFHTFMFHRMTVSVFRFDRHALMTADVSVFLGEMEARFSGSSPLRVWYLMPISRRVALLLTPPGNKDQVVTGGGALAQAICSAMLRLARPPETTEGGPAVKWGYAFRHPDDGHLDRLMDRSTHRLELDAAEVPRHARTSAGRRLTIPR